MFTPRMEGETVEDQVEVREKVRRQLPSVMRSLLCRTQQIVDQRLGMDLFLNIKRWGLDDEIASILLILAAPDELRVEVRVA